MKHEDVEFGSLSLNQIDRLYPRERLLVRPSLWTSRQLALLSCHFQDVESSDASIETTLITPSPSPTPSSPRNNERNPGNVAQKSQRPTWDYSTRRARDLCRPPNAKHAHATLKDLVEYDRSLFFKTGECIAFRFNGRRADKLTCALFALRGASGVGSTTIPELQFGYLNYEDVRAHRRKDHRVRFWHPAENVNPPVFRLYEKKLARLWPQKWTQDPYIAAALISIAQLQQQNSTSNSISNDSRPSGAQQPCYKPTLIATHFGDQEAIHIYSAKVSSNFLERFDKPSCSPDVQTGLLIEHKTISFQPFETLRQRLVAEMVLHCPGRPANQISASIDVELATRETPVLSTPCSISQKRKRETEVDVVYDNKRTKLPFAKLGTNVRSEGTELIGASA